jgi:hypothetical protein
MIRRIWRREKLEGQKFRDCIITDTGMEPTLQKQGLISTHILRVNENRIKDFFSVDCTWYWSASVEHVIESPRVAEINQVIGMVGLNPDDPNDLAGEVVICIDGDKKVLNRSCLIFIPAGTSYGPIQIKRLNNPMFYVTISPRNINQIAPIPGEQKYTIITTTKPKSNPPPKQPTLNSVRILHIEDDMARGAFYVDFVWLYNGYGVLPAPEHVHEWEELIAMVGTNPEHPDDIGGILSIDLEGEPYYITKSSLICIPKLVKHCPWKFLDIRKPTLVFTAGTAGMYVSSHKEKW